jgi:hypothetical protein
MKKLLLTTAMFMAALSIVQARADTLVGDITSDHCDCLTGQTSGGTVTISDAGTNALTFTVSLLNGNQFVGGGFEATFAFNLDPNQTITYSGLNVDPTTGYHVVNGFGPGNLQQTAGSLMVDGYGTFEYGVDGNFSGNSKNVSTDLTFTITGTSLTLASLQQTFSNDGSTPFFAIDIFGNGNTGAVDVSSLHQVPGPLVGAGIPGLAAACLGMFGLNRQRRKRRIA